MNLRRFQSLPWLPGSLLVIAILVSYHGVWQAGYIWDDSHILTRNPCIIGPLGLKEIWTTKAADICPLSISALWLEYRFWGSAAPPYHWVNLGLHAVCALLLWRVLATLRVPGAWLGAALWALHPVQVESVAWIAEIKNVQSGIFFLLAVWCFVCRPQRRGSRGLLWLTWLFAALAMASKTAALVLPAVLLLLDVWLRRRWRWRTCGELAPVALCSLAAGWLSLWTQTPSAAEVLVTHSVRSWPERIAIAGDAIWFYLGKLIWPHPLMTVYPRWQLAGHVTPGMLALAAAAAGLGILWWKRQWWTPAPLVAALFFLICLSPMLGLVEISYFRHAFVADHFLYLASLGPLALAGAGFAQAAEIPRFRHWAWTGAAAVVSTFLFLTCRHSTVFRSEETLWTDTLAKNPACWAGYDGLANVREFEGRIDEAIADARRALAIEPTAVEIRDHLGNLLLREGKIDEAIDEYRLSLATEGDYTRARADLGFVYAKIGRLDDAARELESALKTAPLNEVARANLGKVYLQQKRLPAAIHEFREVLRVDPNDYIAVGHLGIALMENGQTADGLAQLRATAQKHPGDASAHANLGYALNLAHQPDAAIAAYQSAVQIDPGNADLHNDLGNALAERARLDEAIIQYRAGLKLKPHDARARTNLGVALTQQGEFDAAVVELKRVLEDQPRDAFALDKLGLVYLQEKRTAEAIAEFSQALQCDPHLVDAQTDLAKAQAQAVATPDGK